MSGAVEDTRHFLARHEDTSARFDRVADLVEGFESTFGLEHLATVHWLVRREGLTGTQAVMVPTYAGNGQKKQFTARQIGLALDVLTAKSWLPEARVS